jgi:hypothetical protein
MELFWQILPAVLVAVIPILSGFLCRLLKRLADEVVQNMEDERVKALVGEIDTAVQSAVNYVNQTFVDELKKAGTFGEDPEYAEEAFRTAYETAIETISSDAMDWISETFGDVRKYLEVKIEESVQYNHRWAGLNG